MEFDQLALFYSLQCIQLLHFSQMHLHTNYFVLQNKCKQQIVSVSCAFLGEIQSTVVLCGKTKSHDFDDIKPL